MTCSYELFGLCFVPIEAGSSFFGFKDFIAAVAILVIVYTVADVRYHFRVQVAPLPLFSIAYFLIGFIGVGTLATDVWISERGLVPQARFLTTGIWLGVLAALFLGLVMTWMYYAFIRPPIFSRSNYKKYANALYRVIAKGSDSELPIIAHEVLFSSESLIFHASRLNKGKPGPHVEGYANDMLLLLANRKFCRHLVSSSPATAVALMEDVTKHKAYRVPIGPFARNVSTEAILNTDSSLYHEDAGYDAGLLGYHKPFSKALYGNFDLIYNLDHNGPLDLHYEVFGRLTGRQFDTFCRVALMAFESYLVGKRWSYQGVIARLLGEISSAAARGISEWDKSPDDWVNNGWQRLHHAVRFLKDAVDLMAKHNKPRGPQRLRLRGDHNTRFQQEDLYDAIAEAMFEVLHSAAYVTGDPDRAWTIHHNSTWGEFFDLSTNSGAWKIVHFKLRRLLYEEVKDLEERPNYKCARMLGLCLNVMGLGGGKPTGGYGRDQWALKKVVLRIAKRSYMRLRAENVDIANACLIGSISFDEAGRRLVKTYAKGLSPEPNREYLALEVPPLAPKAA